jgi:hypothetical protein
MEVRHLYFSVMITSKRIPIISTQSVLLCLCISDFHTKTLYVFLAPTTHKSNDVVVIWRGANDIGRNNTKEALNYITNFMTDNEDENIVIINSPQRHDLIPSSCVNKEVLKFNRQIKKITKLHPNVQLLELKLDRNHFTTHGLHLNTSGKKLVSTTLARMIEQPCKSKHENPICIPWKDPPVEGNYAVTQDQITDTVNPKSACSSRHHRDCPTRRNPDFLWT